MGNDNKKPVEPLCSRWDLVRALGDQKTANAIAEKESQAGQARKPAQERFTV